MKGRIEKGFKDKVFQRWRLRAGRGRPGRRSVRVYAINKQFRADCHSRDGIIVLESLVRALNVICMGWRFCGREGGSTGLWGFHDNTAKQITLSCLRFETPSWECQIKAKDWTRGQRGSPPHLIP